MSLQFESYPKTVRYEKGIAVITEKIDGTNGQIVFSSEGDILVGSRNRVITPDDDNYGFAKWAYQNKDKLFQVLGPGRHYGEWWGLGIQRGYGLTEKRFSLFNSLRWDGLSLPDIGLYVVPTLWKGSVSVLNDSVELSVQELEEFGSKAAPGFMNYEGLCVYFPDLKSGYKLPLNK